MNAHAIMKVKSAIERGILIVLSLVPFLKCMEITQKDHASEITTHYKYVEKYQLPGELRDFCEITGDCREFAYTCIRNFCECAEGYRADERNKTCVGGVGAKCHYDSHCIENAFCRHQLLCFCKREYWVMSDDYWNCKGEWESKASRDVNKIFLVYFFIVGIQLLL